MADDKTEKQLSTTLAELVAWYGSEQNLLYFKRLQKAERLLKRVAPDVLKEEKQRALAASDCD